MEPIKTIELDPEELILLLAMLPAEKRNRIKFTFDAFPKKPPRLSVVGSGVQEPADQR